MNMTANRFEISLARIEAETQDEIDPQVRITFRIARAPIFFHVPVILRAAAFDDTEMVRAARNSLHSLFVELADKTRTWQLTEDELLQLSDMNLRPKA